VPKRVLGQAGFAQLETETGLVRNREPAVHHSHGRESEPFFPDLVLPLGSTPPQIS
jgi:hypothetical protein